MYLQVIHARASHSTCFGGTVGYSSRRLAKPAGFLPDQFPAVHWRRPLEPSIGAVHWSRPLELSIGNHRAEVANAWRRHAPCAALASSKRLEAVASIFSLTRSHGRLTHGRLCESVGYFSLTRQRKLSAVMYRVFPSGPKVQLLVRPPVINRPSSLP